MKTIRIVYEKIALTLCDRLEGKAKAIALDEIDSRQTQPLNTLGHQIALVLDQIEQWRSLHHTLSLSLLRQECYLDTDLHRLNQPRYVHYPYHYRRDRLKDRLRGIEKERRELAISMTERLGPLHSKLLELVEQHTQLSI